MLKQFCKNLLLIALLAFAGNSIAADPQAGKAKSQTCAACHGPDGNSVNPMWPKLAGQHAQYTVKQLQAFKSGARQNAQMAGMAAPLSEEDMQDLAAFYATQETEIGVADPQFLEAGERLYRYGNAEKGLPACMACHGPDGAGNPAAVYPKLSGQHADYTAAQLRAYRSGERHTDPNQMMRIIADKMNDAEIRAVSAYIQGLH